MYTHHPQTKHLLEPFIYIINSTFVKIKKYKIREY